jgi:hypothetical protein
MRAVISFGNRVGERNMAGKSPVMTLDDERGSEDIA